MKLIITVAVIIFLSIIIIGILLVNPGPDDKYQYIIYRDQRDRYYTCVNFDPEQHIGYDCESQGGFHVEEYHMNDFETWGKIK